MRFVRSTAVAAVTLLLLVPALVELAGSQTADLHERTGDCGACRNWVTNLGADHFARDPHASVPCARCHHPHTAREPEEWRITCQSADCHPRAWPRSVYHRISDATVFVECTNCHLAHDWTADGEDCLSCHQPDTIAPVETAGGVFAHGVHDDFECAACHVTEDRHSRVTVQAPGDCQSCHHGPQAADCASCHAGGGGDLAVQTAMSLSQSTEPRMRSLNFSHQIHDMLDCGDCHGASLSRNLDVQCSSCHDIHHDESLDCASCHGTPAGSAHNRSVHYQTCEQSGCHSTTVPFSWEGRQCMVCHTDKEDHYPANDCSYCHFSPPGGE